jgi:hypothetical protein
MQQPLYKMPRSALHKAANVARKFCTRKAGIYMAAEGLYDFVEEIFQDHHRLPTFEETWEAAINNAEGVQNQSGEAPVQQLKPKMPSFADVSQAFAMHVTGNYVSKDEDQAIKFVYGYIARHFEH